MHFTVEQVDWFLNLVLDRFHWTIKLQLQFIRWKTNRCPWLVSNVVVRPSTYRAQQKFTHKSGKYTGCKRNWVRFSNIFSWNWWLRNRSAKLDGLFVSETPPPTGRCTLVTLQIRECTVQFLNLQTRARVGTSRTRKTVEKSVSICRIHLTS